MPPSRRLLVISYYFPPDGAVGGLRWAGLSRYLARLHGWEVHVVTASPRAAETAIPGVTVHVARRRTTLNDRYRSVRSRSSESAPAVPSQETDAKSTGSGPVAALRREAGYALSMPDIGRGWVLNATRLARRLNRQYRFDAVISTGPPHSSHVVGALVAGRASLLLDYRDPWEHQLNGSRGPDDPRLRDLIEPSLRRFVERRASAVIAVTNEFAEELRTRWVRKPVYWLRNGVDPERVVRRASELESYVSYVGTLYFGRDLAPVLQGLHRVLNADEDRPDVTLRVAGPMDAPHRDRFMAEMQRLDLGHRTELFGVLPGSEALEITRRSCLSVILAQGQPRQIPAKLYEVIGMGAPALVIAEADSASFREAARLDVPACEPADVAGIARAILDACQGRDGGGGAAKVAEIGHPYLAGELNRLLEMDRAGGLRDHSRSNEPARNMLAND